MRIFISICGCQVLMPLYFDKFIFSVVTRLYLYFWMISVMISLHYPHLSFFYLLNFFILFLFSDIFLSPEEISPPIFVIMLYYDMFETCDFYYGWLVIYETYSGVPFVHFVISNNNFTVVLWKFWSEILEYSLHLEK